MRHLLDHVEAALANLRRSMITKLNVIALTLIGFLTAYMGSALQVLAYLPGPLQKFIPILMLAWFAAVQWAAHRDAEKAKAEAAAIATRIAQIGSTGNG